MSGGRSTSSVNFRQRCSQGYSSSGDDLEDDACSRTYESVTLVHQAKGWEEVMENVLWLVSAAFIVYYGDQRQNLLCILWSDSRINRKALHLGLLAVVLDMCLIVYTVFLVYTANGFHGSISLAENWNIKASIFWKMEEVTDAVNNLSLNDSHKKNRIQVSNTKKPLFFYVNLAKRYMQQYNEVELSALGMAIATVVTIAEILKNSGLAVEKKIMTSTVDMKDESRGRPIQKAKIEILLGKSEKFDELMAAAVDERDDADAEGDEQS
ncbi:hypothetical protein HPP92_002433 [Vanilla planifolia]|uniref:DNA/RNA-binding protein Alba-like domain-containing protein n=1 Tax=Vanilla planifolia TaxID=51239 RepID=A0A835VMS0_VANPL|nr:hypothetical protein HPP92_002433 [Vanilla planifolia]